MLRYRMNNLHETVNEFLDEFYPNNAVQKCRWKKRLDKDPSELKGADLALYQVMLFASRRSETEDIKPLSIGLCPHHTRIHTGSLMVGKSLDPVSTTIDELKTNYKKVCKNFKPVIKKWTDENKHVDNFKTLHKSYKKFNKLYNEKVLYYVELYEDLYDENDCDTCDELIEIEQSTILTYKDTLFNGLCNNLPLVSFNNPTGRGTIRLYTETALNDFMKQTLLKADELRLNGCGVDYYRVKQWVETEHKPLIKQLEENIKNFKRSQNK